MDANVTANLKALAQAANPVVIDDGKAAKTAKAKAKARLNREIGEKASLLKASLRLFLHVFIITGALLTTDWLFNNGLQTSLIYRGNSPNRLVSVMKNKAYHVNAYFKSTFAF